MGTNNEGASGEVRITIIVVQQRKTCFCGNFIYNHLHWLSGLRVSVLVLGSSPGQGQCVVFLGKTFYSHRTFLQPGIYMGTDGLLGIET